MIRPLPSQHPSTLPSARHCPDPQHIEDLSRLGDEITEMAAHLATGTAEDSGLFSSWKGELLQGAGHDEGGDLAQ